MPRASLAFEHWQREQAGEAEKVLANMYAEPNRSNPKLEGHLVTTPGTRLRTAGTITGTIRGMGQADAFASGHVIIVDGTTVRTWNPANASYGTISGTVTGSDRVDIAFSQTEMAILSGGSLYVSGGSTIAVVTDPDFPASITSIASMSQRILLTAGDGKFWYTDVLNAGSISALSFYTAEASPDNLIAVRVWAEQALMFGSETIELWYAEPSNANDPFSRSSSVVPVGCLARDTIAITTKGPVWVAPDYTVRALNGPDALVISPAWVSRVMGTVAPGDLIASTYEKEGHTFYVLNAPSFCAVCDLTDGSWHRRYSGTSGTWSWAMIASVNGKEYVAKRAAGVFAEMSRAFPTDEQADANTLGTDIVREWTAHIPQEAGTQVIGTIVLESSKGIGRASGDGSDPIVQMRISNDNGNTWTTYRDGKLGAQGAYEQRTVWHRNGRGKRPQTILQFKASEPVQFSVEGVVYGEVS
jgi:hypothetical protein